MGIYLVHGCPLSSSRISMGGPFPSRRYAVVRLSELWRSLGYPCRIDSRLSGLDVYQLPSIPGHWVWSLRQRSTHRVAIPLELRLQLRLATQDMTES